MLSLPQIESMCSCAGINHIDCPHCSTTPKSLKPGCQLYVSCITCTNAQPPPSVQVCADVITKTVAELGRIDILVNNGGSRGGVLGVEGIFSTQLWAASCSSL
jgi:NAD(P)-dependent dehydrogenase (short-subunit alcohol dehydrogenase family)